MKKEALKRILNFLLENEGKKPEIKAIVQEFKRGH